MATWGDPTTNNFRGHEENPRDPRCRRALRRADLRAQEATRAALVAEVRG